MSRSKVERYIEATRLNCKDRLMGEFYAKFYFQKLHFVAQAVNLTFHPVLAYSATRRAERVHIDGEYWFVYDQYMGQTMNLLNRIFLEADGELPGIVYLHKLLGEMFLEAGRSPEALHSAQFYANHRDELSAKHLQDDLRGLFTTCQELFYMFHEMGHLAFGLPHGYVALVQVQAVDLLGMKREFDREKSAEPAPVGSGNGPRKVLDPDYERIRRSAFDADGLAEEVFCDTWAGNALLSSSVVTDENFFDVLRAVYIGFYHLQVVAYVEGLVNNPHDEQRRQYAFAQVQIRSHCLRSHLIFHYEAHMVKEGQDETDHRERISNQLVQDQTRYYESIFDGFMRVGHAVTRDGELDRFIRDVLDTLATVPGFPELDELQKRLDMDEMTRAMTGWPSLSTFE